MHLRRYLHSTKSLGCIAAIAVNSLQDEVKRIVDEEASGLDIHILPVPCWGAFVPALNTLLGFAQRRGMKYILYQSLEVQCTQDVLQRLLDHHTADTLVVGPTVDGHTFQEGEQPLNGRTSPWNTLALWSVRKLGLTGFLSIADGMPAGGGESPESKAQRRPASFGFNNPQEDEREEEAPMGSDAWWTECVHLCPRLNGKPNDVPAGVEEVTAIALLQHLLGSAGAVAILLKLPPELEDKVAWKANWAGDERRKQWHDYKMKSKVTRPAAQLEQLFQLKRSSSNDRIKEEADSQTEGQPEQPRTDLHFGTVMHFSTTIRPPQHVERICLLVYALYSANFTAVLASVFRHVNETPAPSIPFVGLLMGGIFLPMPVSLWLIRNLTRRLNHFAGLILFACVLVAGHLCIVLSQLCGNVENRHMYLLAARIFQGLGSGVCFQARFVLASLSTSNQHQDLQAWSFLMGDLGLGLGALLPAATSMFSSKFLSEAPELAPSAILALISLAYLIWIVIAFPRHLHFLPHSVRFPGSKVLQGSKDPAKEASKEEGTFRKFVWISGTTRVFVQSSVFCAVALLMRDAELTGHFRQCFAVAALCLFPMPFEMLASRVCCTCSTRSKDSGNPRDLTMITSGALGAAVFVGIVAWTGFGDEGESRALLVGFLELAALMVALSIAAPFNASRQYGLRDAERATVLLEWMKAYIGRLLSPLFAIVMYNFLGYRALLSVLCALTAIATLTA